MVNSENDGILIYMDNDNNNWLSLSDDDDGQQIDLNNLVLNIVDDELAEEGIGKLVSYGLFSFILCGSGMASAA